MDPGVSAISLAAPPSASLQLWVFRVSVTQFPACNKGDNHSAHLRGLVRPMTQKLGAGPRQQ